MSAPAALYEVDVFISLYNWATQAWDDVTGPVESSQLSFAPQIERKNKTSRRIGKTGQVIASVGIPQPTEFALTIDEITKETLTLAMMGEREAINEPGGSLVDEPIALPSGGVWVPLGARNFSATGFTVTDGAAVDPVVYVLGRDYEVQWAMGMIRALPGGTITTPATVEVSGTFNAVSGTRILGSRQADVRMKLYGEARNMVDSSRGIITVHQAVVTPSEAFDFLSDEFATLALTGIMETPPGMPSPYTFEMLD
jgi:hypothetical protein